MRIAAAVVPTAPLLEGAGATTAPDAVDPTAVAGFEALLAGLVPSPLVPVAPAAPTTPLSTETESAAPVPAAAEPVTGERAAKPTVQPAATAAPAPAAHATDEPTAPTEPTAETPQTPTPAPTAGPEAAASPEPAPAVALPTTPATTLPPSVAVAAAPAPAPVATPAPAPAAATTPVTRQVFEGIERLASSGNGTHRITLRLDPGTLGEVRVHLTVRDGLVRVRLGAGAEAGSALREGAPELQRLLQARGADDVRVAVHRISEPAAAQAAGQPAAATAATAVAPAAAPSPTPLTGDAGPHHDLLGSHPGSEWSGPGTGQQGALAGTRRAATARDGDQDRVHGPTSVEPSTPRPRGVDVRM